MTRRAAARLVVALQVGDVDGVIACFDPERKSELWGVQLQSCSIGAGKNHIVEEGRDLGHELVTRR